MKFYKRFGFVENKGRKKDFTISEGMYREPQQPEVLRQEAVDVGDPESPVVDLSYRIEHTAPRVDGNNVLSDVSDKYPDDFYDSSVAGRFYGQGDQPAMDRAVAEVVAQFRDRPDAEVTIYRAVPEGVEDINPGDWVTLTREYAEFHGWRRS